MRTVSGKYLRCVGSWGWFKVKIYNDYKKNELFTLLTLWRLKTPIGVVPHR